MKNVKKIGLSMKNKCGLALQLRKTDPIITTREVIITQGCYNHLWKLS